MEKKLLKALVLTILIQAGIYHFSGDRSTWNQVWVIIPLFCGCFFAVNSYSGRIRKRRGFKKNVIDLEQYRRKKKIKKKRDQQRKERKEVRRKRVVIYKSCDRSKIELLQSILHSSQIEFFSKNLHSVSLLPSIEGIDVEIQVNKTDVEKAVKLLKEHNLTPLEISP